MAVITSYSVLSTEYGVPSTSPPMHTLRSPDAPADRSLPLVVLLFVGSGCAALIYEIVWLQLLQLVIGSSAVSLGVLLGTFMGGMCLGSLLFPLCVSARQHPAQQHHRARETRDVDNRPSQNAVRYDSIDSGANTHA